MDVMKPATKVAAICLGAIAIAAVTLFCLSQYFRVDYPVLCRMYGAYPVYAGEGEMNMNQNLFRIPYIRCEAGKNQIAYISFKEFPELVLTDEDESDGDQEDYYSVHRLSISLAEDEATFPGLKKPVTLTAATVFYNDGTKETFDIGKIVLYPESDSEEKGLKCNGDPYEENGERRISFITREESVLQSFECLPDIKGCDLKVNKKDFRDVKEKVINKDRQLDFALTIAEKPFTLYEPALRVTCKNSKGNTYTQTLASFTQDLYEEEPSFFEILSYLKERGVI